MVYAITDNVLYDHLLYDVTILIMVMFVTLKEISFHISSPLLIRVIIKYIHLNNNIFLDNPMLFIYLVNNNNNNNKQRNPL